MVLTDIASDVIVSLVSDRKSGLVMPSYCAVYQRLLARISGCIELPNRHVDKHRYRVYNKGNAGVLCMHIDEHICS